MAASLARLERHTPARTAARARAGGGRSGAVQVSAYLFSQRRSADWTSRAGGVAQASRQGRRAQPVGAASERVGDWTLPSAGVARGSDGGRRLGATRGRGAWPGGMASSSASGSPSAVQIREANAHLAALHGRVAELEQRLAAAEETVRGQAESLIRKDGQMRRALAQLRQSKEREIAALEEKLQSSEDNAQKLLGTIQEKDHLIAQLSHRSRLLTKICRSRPVLDNLLAYMAEGEQLSPIPGARSDASSPDGGLLPETNCTLDSDTQDFSLCDDDQDADKTLFGTTV
ncbi:vimentin-type intermediate filament-associated coiled-coil protein [Hemicordylus capensis]|uniref:vimentin-type intermediate filament-associated coiled-coil protein n=1 Tax=Hemicordylus capensis TaxID=884348 RepID=UPI0023027707|nr:vimentin-type intermediate filament-associated coiled-coil protein [Hemicordylus capensis]